jgi:hypothetical protein
MGPVWFLTGTAAAWLEDDFLAPDVLAGIAAPSAEVIAAMNNNDSLAVEATTEVEDFLTVVTPVDVEIFSAAAIAVTNGDRPSAVVATTGVTNFLATAAPDFEFDGLSVTADVDDS